MKVSSLYIPSELLSSDGDQLGKDEGIYFSWGVLSPHMQCEQVNAVIEDDLTPTIILPTVSKQNSLWNEIGTKSRNIGYVIRSHAEIYSSEELIEIADKLSFGANIELIESEDGSYKVIYYVPRDIDDPKHHSKFDIQNDVDIFESEYLIKKEGYIKSDDIGIIEDFENQGCKISVFASNSQTHDETIGLYVKNELFPFCGTFNGDRYPKFLLYDCIDGAEIRDEEVEKILVLTILML